MALKQNSTWFIYLQSWQLVLTSKDGYLNELCTILGLLQLQRVWITCIDQKRENGLNKIIDVYIYVHAGTDICVSTSECTVDIKTFKYMDSTGAEHNNWKARCKNGLSDDFGPTFTKHPNYVLSCNVTVAKWIVSCSQHIVLVIWIEFPPKFYQVTLLLARKVKLPKCQEIPIISAGGKKQFCCCPWWMWLKKKKNHKRDLQQWITWTGKGAPETFYTPKWQILFYRPVTLSSATFLD